MKKINIIWITMFSSALLSLLPSQLLFAATGDQLVVSAGSTYQMSTGTTFTVEVKTFISSTATPQTAIGNVKYPTGQLRFVSAQPNGSGFGNPTISANNPGLVYFDASRSSTGKGFVKIFDITFQAIGAGTAVVDFTGDSEVNKANGGVTAYKSAVFSITNPAPNPNPAPSTQPKPAPSTQPPVAPVPIPTTSTIPSPSTSPSPDATVVVPDPNGVVTSVDIEPDYTSSRITWKVTAPNPKSSLSFGTRSSELNQSAAVTQATDGSFVSTITGLKPGERYYFAINGSGDGNKNGIYSSTLTTNGYPVRIVVTENDIPAKGAQVRINNLVKVTDAEGKVTIGLAEGDYKGKITTDTASLDITVRVERKTIPSDGTAPPTQAFSFKLTSSPLEQGPGSGAAVLTFVGVLFAGTAIIGVGFIGFMTYRRRKLESQLGGNPTTTVIIDDGYDWQNQSHQLPPPPAITPTEVPQPHHNNSVYIDDAEPTDMFDKK